jgi:hypothetical protein
LFFQGWCGLVWQKVCSPPADYAQQLRRDTGNSYKVKIKKNKKNSDCENKTTGRKQLISQIYQQASAVRRREYR